MKKKSKKQQALELAVLSLLAVPVFAVNSAEAAEAEEADKSRDIVVTASKMEMEIKAEPAAVEVITAEDIRRLGATNVRDALALASNINVSKAGMVGNAVMVRGNNTNHTLIMVDGMRMASEDTPTTENYYKLAQINVNDIERIEIVRGSGSVLYGSDAIGGVINIITRHSDKPSYAVGISTGTEDINNYYNFNFGKEGRWTTSLNMQFSKIRRNNHEDVGSGVYPMYGTRQYYDFKAV
ncbi:MAG: TonB-dependent receptor plug domain-containing protein, partial [Anaerovibrio sp.]|nr:TonB-dependent receptor plug domain-containing protein [Anaerovibrio sp.]